MIKNTEGGYLISQIHQLSGRIFTRKLNQYQIDLNHAQGKIIFALWKKDRVSITDLAKETALSKSTLTTMLERLEKSGHLIRKQSETDKRTTIVYLTPKSSSLRADYQKVSWDMNKIYYKGFTRVRISRFESSLKKILKNLKKESNCI
jgi:DNA-binding MarR family transcriptional regulator